MLLTLKEFCFTSPVSPPVSAINLKDSYPSPAFQINKIKYLPMNWKNKLELSTPVWSVPRLWKGAGTADCHSLALSEHQEREQMFLMVCRDVLFAEAVPVVFWCPHSGHHLASRCNWYRRPQEVSA